MAVAETIDVQVNGEQREVPSGVSIHGLLEHLALKPELVVVERNGEILRRERYPQVQVEPGDVLELVHFVGGGGEGPSDAMN